MRTSSWVGIAIGVAAMAGVGYYGYRKFKTRTLDISDVPAEEPVQSETQTPNPVDSVETAEPAVEPIADISLADAFKIVHAFAENAEEQGRIPNSYYQMAIPPNRENAIVVMCVDEQDRLYGRVAVIELTAEGKLRLLTSDDVLVLDSEGTKLPYYTDAVSDPSIDMDSVLDAKDFIADLALLITLAAPSAATNAS